MAAYGTGSEALRRQKSGAGGGRDNDAKRSKRGGAGGSTSIILAAMMMTMVPQSLAFSLSRLDILGQGMQSLRLRRCSGRCELSVSRMQVSTSDQSLWYAPKRVVEVDGGLRGNALRIWLEVGHAVIMIATD